MSHTEYEPEPAQERARLRAVGVEFSIDGKRILDDVSMQVYPGELLGLIGPNGAGKSTLLSILAGLRTPGQGTLQLDQREFGKISPRERARLLAWLEQSGAIHWPITVERLVSLGRMPHLSAWQKPAADDAETVSDALASTDCEHLRTQDATTLSGGERVRVLLARALASEPEILLADEALASLDPGHQLQTMDLLRTFSRGKNACVTVLHDLSLAARYCDRLYLLDKGRVIASGKAEAVLSKENIRRVYGVEVLSGWQEVPWIVPHKITQQSG